MLCYTATDKGKTHNIRCTCTVPREPRERGSQNTLGVFQLGSLETDFETESREVYCGRRRCWGEVVGDTPIKK